MILYKSDYHQVITKWCISLEGVIEIKYWLSFNFKYNHDLLRGFRKLIMQTSELHPTFN